jgi:hypothetical protein
MNKLLFLRPVLVSLDHGSLLRRMNAILLYAVAISIVIGLGYGIFLLFKNVNSTGAINSGSTGPDSGMKMFFVIYTLITILAVIVVVIQILYIRATQLWQAERTHYGAMQVISTVIKAYGESAFVLLLLFGNLGMIFTWIEGSGMIDSPGSPFAIWLPISVHLFGDNNMLSGLLFFINTLLFGTILLTIIHFISESVMVFGDMATRLTNIEENRRATEHVPASVVSPPLPQEYADVQ